MAGLVQTTLAHRAEVDDRNNAMTLDLARGWFAVEERLEPIIAALAYEQTQARAQGRPVKASTIAQSERYQTLLATMRAEFSRYETEWAIGRIDDLQRQLATIGGQQANVLLAATGLDSSVFGTFDFLSFESIINAAREGQPLMAILDKGYDLAAASIADRLIAGVALGINPRALAAGMVKDGLSQGLNHVLLVSRDQGIRAWRSASQARYQQAGIRQYRRTAARQARTCIACLALDGTIHDSSEIFPNHPQCRCTMIPLVEGGTPPALAPAGEWLANQTPAQQKAILGPGRYEEYKAGRPLGDMVGYKTDPTWGKGTRIKPLGKPAS
jgi:SPP1 gp7 family putative phage head morphogenesis protein